MWTRTPAQGLPLSLTRLFDPRTLNQINAGSSLIAAVLAVLLIATAQKTSPSYEVKDSDIRRAVTALAAVPAATLPDSAFLSALGTPAARMVPPQTGSLAQRAIEEWERNLCENKAVASLSGCRLEDLP